MFDITKRPFDSEHETLNDAWEKMVTDFQKEIERINKNQADITATLNILVDTLGERPD